MVILYNINSSQLKFQTVNIDYLQNSSKQLVNANAQLLYYVNLNIQFIN